MFFDPSHQTFCKPIILHNNGLFLFNLFFTNAPHALYWTCYFALYQKEKQHWRCKYLGQNYYLKNPITFSSAARTLHSIKLARHPSSMVLDATELSPFLLDFYYISAFLFLIAEIFAGLRHNTEYVRKLNKTLLSASVTTQLFILV